MSNQSVALPSFLSPPVSEVVLSVQFDPIAGFQLHHFGVLWEVFKSRFPKVETQPPLDQLFEPLKQTPPKPAIRLDFSGQWIWPRMWLINEAGTELIQIQRDRFIHNWRKTGEGDEYPRYEHLRQQFSEELAAFRKWLLDHSMEAPRPNQCEIAYINHIRSGEEWKDHSEAAIVLNLLAPDGPTELFGKLESLNLAARYLISDDESPGRDPVGRLHVELVPAFAVSDNSPLFVLNLTARGIPFGQDDDGILKFLDLGRKTIVRGFKAITTTKMHQIWRLENGS